MQDKKSTLADKHDYVFAKGCCALSANMQLKHRVVDNFPKTLFFFLIISDFKQSLIIFWVENNADLGVGSVHYKCLDLYFELLWRKCN